MLQHLQFLDLQAVVLPNREPSARSFTRTNLLWRFAPVFFTNWNRRWVLDCSTGFGGWVGVNSSWWFDSERLWLLDLVGSNGLGLAALEDGRDDVGEQDISERLVHVHILELTFYF